MKHTADHRTSPILAECCEVVAELHDGESCMIPSEILRQVETNYSNDRPLQRILENVIGSRTQIEHKRNHVNGDVTFIRLRGNPNLTPNNELARGPFILITLNFIEEWNESTLLGINIEVWKTELDKPDVIDVLLSCTTKKLWPVKMRETTIPAVKRNKSNV